MKQKDSDIAHFKDQIVKKEAEIEAKTKEFNELEEKANATAEDLQNEIANLNKRVQQSDDALVAEKTTVSDLEEKLKFNESVIEQSQLKIDELTNQKATACEGKEAESSKVAKLKKQRDTVGAAMNKYFENYKQCYAKLEQAQSKIKELGTEKKKQEDDIAKLEAEKANLEPEFAAKLKAVEEGHDAELEKVQREHTAKVDEFEAKKAKYAEKMKAMTLKCETEKRTMLKAHNDETNLLKDQMAENNSKLNQAHDGVLAELQSKLKDLEGEKAACEQHLENVRGELAEEKSSRAADKEAHQNDIEQVRGELAEEKSSRAADQEAHQKKLEEVAMKCVENNKLSSKSIVSIYSKFSEY